MLQQTNEETQYLDGQIKQLTKDRIKIQQNNLVIETRVLEVESTMGFH